MIAVALLALLSCVVHKLFGRPFASDRGHEATRCRDGHSTVVGIDACYVRHLAER